MLALCLLWIHVPFHWTLMIIPGGKRYYYCHFYIWSLRTWNSCQSCGAGKWWSCDLNSGLQDSKGKTLNISHQCFRDPLPPSFPWLPVWVRPHLGPSWGLCHLVLCSPHWVTHSSSSSARDLLKGRGPISSHVCISSSCHFFWHVVCIQYWLTRWINKNLPFPGNV